MVRMASNETCAKKGRIYGSFIETSGNEIYTTHISQSYVLEDKEHGYVEGEKANSSINGEKERSNAESVREKFSSSC